MEAQWKPKKHVDDVDQDDGVRLGRHGRREDARVCQGDARAHGVSALCEDGRSSVALPSASRRRWARTRCPGRRDHKTAHTGGDDSSSVILGIARSQGCSGSSGARAQFPTALPKFMALYCETRLGRGNEFSGGSGHSQVLASRARQECRASAAECRVAGEPVRSTTARTRVTRPGPVTPRRKGKLRPVSPPTALAQ